MVRIDDRDYWVSKIDELDAPHGKKHHLLTLLDVETRGVKTWYADALLTGSPYQMKFKGEWAEFKGDLNYGGYFHVRRFTTFRGLYRALHTAIHHLPNTAVLCADDEHGCALGWTLFLRASEGHLKEWGCTFQISLLDVRADLTAEPRPTISEYIKTFAGRCKLGVAMYDAAFPKPAMPGVPTEGMSLASVFAGYETDPIPLPATWQDRLASNVDELGVVWSDRMGVTFEGTLSDDMSRGQAGRRPEDPPRSV